MLPNEYKCAKCSGIFTKGWTDEEAKEEALNTFGYIVIEQSDTWCDDCYHKLFNT